MIARSSAWWQARTPREHGLLILLALIAVPTLFWYGAILPVERALDRAQLARDADAHILADVLMMAGKIRSAGQTDRTALPIEAQVRAEAERADFTVAGLSREGDGAMLTIDAVRAQPFFAWIAAIRQSHGLIVTRLTARPNADSTLSVTVRLTRAR